MMFWMKKKIISLNLCQDKSVYKVVYCLFFYSVNSQKRILPSRIVIFFTKSPEKEINLYIDIFCIHIHTKVRVNIFSQRCDGFCYRDHKSPSASTWSIFLFFILVVACAGCLQKYQCDLWPRQSFFSYP